jgi:hypothetical protein
MKNVLTILFFFVISFNPLVSRAQEEESYQRFDVNKDDVKEDPLMKEYPELKKFRFEEPKAGIYLGVGASPIAMIGSKIMFSVNLFQVHYMSKLWDIEILSASIGQVITSNEFADSKHFTLKFSPKFILMNIFETGTLSIGPVIGYEAVKFPSIKARKTRPGSNGEPLSTKYDVLTGSGMIFGGVMSETFSLRKGRKFKVSQYFYTQNYDVRATNKGLKYEYENPSVSTPENLAEIEADSVFLLDFAYLF